MCSYAEAMPIIYLMRHGKASPEADDYDELSGTGYEQARLLGAELKRRELRVGPVVTGSLRRQRQTAGAALAEAGPAGEPTVDPRWDEYDHLRLLAQNPRESGTLQERLDASLSAWTATGETGPGTWNHFRDGVMAGLTDVVSRVEKGQTALVFTSAGVIATVCSLLLDTSAAGFLALNRIVVNGSMTKLLHGRSGTQLVSFNDHAHLEHGGPDLMTYR